MKLDLENIKKSCPPIAEELEKIENFAYTKSYLLVNLKIVTLQKHLSEISKSLSLVDDLEKSHIVVVGLALAIPLEIMTVALRQRIENSN